MEIKDNNLIIYLEVVVQQSIDQVYFHPALFDRFVFSHHHIVGLLKPSINILL